MTGPTEGRLPRAETPGVCFAAAVALLGAAAFVYWSSIHDLPFHTKGEPREAIVVQQMVARHDFIAPLRHRGEIASKPPLFHWLGSLASTVYGAVTETTVRFPSAVASLAVLGATLWAGYRAFGTSAALAAATILLTSQQWLQSSTAARVDMVLTLALTAGLFSLWNAWRVGRPEVPLGFYLGSAAAVLAKGPVGYVLPALILSAAVLVRRGRPQLRILPRPSAAALVALALPLLWYLLAWQEIGQLFIDKVVFKENLYRVVDAESAGTGHLAPWYYYFPALLGGMAPWSLLLPVVIHDLWRRRREPDPGATWFLAVWVLVTLVFFSLAGSKRAVYLLPAYPALALLLGSWLDRAAGRASAAEENSPLRRWAGYASGASLAAAAVATAAAAVGVPFLSNLANVMNPKDAANLNVIATSLQSRWTTILCWSGTTGAAAWILARSIARHRVWPAFCATSGVLVLAAAIGSSVLRDMARANSLEGFMGDVVRRVPSTEPLSFYPDMKYLEYFKPAAVYYAKRPIPVGFEAGELSAAPRIWLLAGQPLPGRICGPRADSGSADAPMGYRCTTVLRHSFTGGVSRDPLYLIAAARETSHDHRD